MLNCRQTSVKQAWLQLATTFNMKSFRSLLARGCRIRHLRQIKYFATGITIRNSLLANGKNIVSDIQSHDGKHLTWYSCGPTVYDVAHIGHARTYVSTDIIRRILMDYFNYDVDFGMGVTDIDDKIIHKAMSNGMQTWADALTMVRAFEDEFMADLDALNVKRPDAILRVTDHIQEIIAYISQIESNGYAYTTNEGVYFDVTKAGPTYGKLGSLPASSHESHDTDDFQAGQEKKSWRDFALWKRVKEGEPSWESPWGPGRPGWHIECSAVTHSYFGSHVDIHSGGVDLKFPHHTNEIVQCEAHNHADEWVRYWLHTGHLYIEGRKMSKSLKNFISIKEFLTGGGYGGRPADDFRLLCLQQKYCASIHFSHARVAEATAYRLKIENFFHLANTALSHSRTTPHDGAKAPTRISTGGILQKKQTLESQKLRNELRRCKQIIDAALRDDFDTPTVLHSLLSLASNGGAYASALISATQVSTNGCTAPAPAPAPVEPLLAVYAYVAKIFNIFGVRLEGSSSKRASQVQAERDFDRCEVELDRFEPAMDALVAFRSSVRNSSLKAIKALKTYQKKDPKMKTLRAKNVDNPALASSSLSSPPSLPLAAEVAAVAVEVAAEGIESSKFSSSVSEDRDRLQSMKERAEMLVRRSLQDIVESCDELRASAGGRLGVRIDDLGEVSAWKRLDK